MAFSGVPSAPLSTFLTCQCLEVGELRHVRNVPHVLRAIAAAVHEASFWFLAEPASILGEVEFTLWRGIRTR